MMSSASSLKNLMVKEGKDMAKKSSKSAAGGSSNTSMQPILVSISKDMIKASDSIGKSMDKLIKILDRVDKVSSESIKLSQRVQKTGDNIAKSYQGTSNKSNQNVKDQKKKSLQEQFAEIVARLNKQQGNASGTTQSKSSGISQSKSSETAQNGSKGSLMSKLGDQAKGAFKSVKGMLIGKIVPILKEAGKNSIKFGSQMRNLQKTTNFVFGKNGEQINKWSKKLAIGFGLSSLQAKKFATSFGTALKSSGITSDMLAVMSEKLTALSGDFSSFYDISQEDAFEKIKAAIGGNVDELQDLGINMSKDKLQAYALANGIKTSYEEMDEASQTALRYKYLMQESKHAQKDFAKDQGSLTKQTTLLKASFQNLATSVGEKVLPIVSKFFENVNNLIGKMDMDKFAEGLAGAFQAAEPIMQWMFTDGLPKIFDFMSSIMDKAKVIYDFISNNWVNIQSIIGGIVAAIGAYKFSLFAITLALKAATIAQEFHNALLIISAIKTIGLAGAKNALAIAEGSATIAQWALNTAMSLSPLGQAIAIIGGITIGVGILVGLVIKLSGGLDNVIKNFKKFGSFLSNLFSGGSKKKSSGDSVDLFESGGIANKPSIFGEAGPEMAIPLKKTPRSLGLLAQTAQILGVAMPNSAATGASSAIQGSGAPNVTINLTINADKGSANDIAVAAEGAIYQAIDRYFRDRERVAYGY